MKRSLLAAVLALLVLAGCAALLWFVAGSGPGTPEPRPEPGPETADPEAGPERVEPGRRRHTDETVEPEAPPQMLALTGRVVAGDAGVPGATVEAYAVPAADAGLTGADLAAREMFGHLLDGAGLRRLVQTSRPGGVEEQIEEVVSTAGADEGSQDAQNSMGRNMRAGMQLLQEDGAMDRMMRFVRLAQARIDFDSPWPLAGTTTSGADGSFAFEEVPAGAIELRVRAPRYVRRKQRVQAGATDVSVRLSQGALLEGSVVSGGQPVAGANVRTRTATLTTDGAGTFRHDSARMPQDTVYVTAPGFMPALALVDVTADGTNEPIVVTLRPAGRVVGRVLDTSGAPVERATVSSGSSGFNPMMFMGLGNADNIEPPAPYTQTAADGQFELEGLPAGAVTIRVEREGFLSAKIEDVEIEIGETAGPLEVELRQASRVEGRVTDTSGAPVVGATAKVQLPSPGGQAAMALTMMGGAWARAETDADGRYVVRGLPAGTRDVQVEAAGYLTAETSVEVPEEGSARKDVTLEAGRSVTGSVTTPDGNPVEGASVTLEAASRGPANPLAAFMGSEPDASTVTAADGTFVMNGLQDGPYEITASSAGYLPVTVEGVATGATDVMLQLGAGATLRGTVTNDLTGEPVGGAWVLRSSSNAAAPANPWMRNLQRAPRVMTDANGAFEMAGLEPGEYTLTARREQYGDSPSVVVNCAAGETTEEIYLVLPQGEVLRGRIVTARDTGPVEGALVFVVRGDSPAMSMSDFSGTQPQAPADSIHATTGPSGDFVLEGLTAGTVTVHVRHIDFAPATLGGVEAPGGDVTIELTEGGAVQGYLRDTERRPIAGRTIMLTQGAMGSGGMRSETTDPEGFYRIDRMRPGSYQLMFTDPKSPFGVSGMTTVTLRDGQTVQHDFGPKVGTRPISGSVVLAGAPLEGATVFLTGTGGDMKFVQTGADGRFRFDGLEPGEYTVVVQREMMGGGNINQKVTVGAEGDVADVRIEVPTAAVSGTVVDGESGDGVAMAQIELIREGATGGATSIEEIVADTAGRGFTDERGRFDIQGVEDGTFSMRVSAAGYAAITLDGVRSGSDGVRVQLSRGQELVVTVIGPDDQPIVRASVTAVDASGAETSVFDMSMSGVTGQDGKATLRLGAGRFTLRVDSIEHPPASLEVESQSGAATVRLVAGGTLDVTVTGADGKPAAGAEVELRDASGKPITRRISMANFAGSTARTDAAGNLQRTGLAPGPITVAVKPATGDEVTQPAQIVAGETTAVEIQLR